MSMTSSVIISEIIVDQVWTSSLSIRWKMEDAESSIVEQFVSLTTRDSIDHNIPTMKVIHSMRDHLYVLYFF